MVLGKESRFLYISLAPNTSEKNLLSDFEPLCGEYENWHDAQNLWTSLTIHNQRSGDFECERASNRSE